MDVLSRISFASALLFCAYTSYRAGGSPNITSEGKGERPESDYLGTRLTMKLAAPFFRFIHVLLPVWNAALVLLPPPSIIAHGRLHQGDPNPLLMTWNWFSSMALCAGIAGGLLRIRAYRDLGKNFTFMLQNPSQLVVTGLYKYMQHPSYTGAFLIVLSLLPFSLRLDGPLATILPPRFVESFLPLNFVGLAILVGASCMLLTIRMRQEERMLKKKFGKEWVQWHESTARLIPGLL